jgi:hypothetical protein
VQIQARRPEKPALALMPSNLTKLIEGQPNHKHLFDYPQYPNQRMLLYFQAYSERIMTPLRLVAGT